ncbi:hypothetical protein Btru_005067 [Bulinus truncatus]|nr:hypothetical protein Btru_005067 [Bulinus truncatus]
MMNIKIKGNKHRYCIAERKPLHIMPAVCLEHLKYFETFSHIGETSRVKRSGENQQLIKELQFQVLQRNFHVILKSGTDVLAEDFQAKLVESDGRMSTFHVDHSRLYSGYLSGDRTVSVKAHIEDTLWNIHIFEHNDTYSVEPAWNLLKPSENPLNHSLIAYRVSDLSQDGGRCGERHHESKKLMKSGVINDHKNHKAKLNGLSLNRTRKAAEFTRPLINTCSLRVIGDYDFFSTRCHRNYLTCSALMISQWWSRQIEYSGSSLFTDLDDNVFSGIGLQIGYMILYTTPTYSSDTRFHHFNAKDIEWDANSKLDYFISFLPRDFCLSHLMTGYSMPYRILGLANKCGICNKSYAGSPVLSSSLLSSTDISYGPLTSHQISQVFVHARSLTSVFCGNGKVDPGEECDAGAMGLVNADICCTRECRLQYNAMCSDMNTQCCFNCYIASRGTVCYDYNIVACKKKSYCTGHSYTCPAPLNQPDWTPCLDGGLCYNGRCLGFCEVKSLRENLTLKACMCRSTAEACKWCCYDNSEPKNPGPCLPHSTDLLRDGRPCHYGYCEPRLARKLTKSDQFDFEDPIIFEAKASLRMKVKHENIQTIDPSPSQMCPQILIIGPDLINR